VCVCVPVSNYVLCVCLSVTMCCVCVSVSNYVLCVCLSVIMCFVCVPVSNYVSCVYLRSVGSVSMLKWKYVSMAVAICQYVC
jgi:hypothetical protein